MEEQASTKLKTLYSFLIKDNHANDCTSVKYAFQVWCWITMNKEPDNNSIGNINKNMSKICQKRCCNYPINNESNIMAMIKNMDKKIQLLDDKKYDITSELSDININSKKRKKKKGKKDKPQKKRRKRVNKKQSSKKQKSKRKRRKKKSKKI